MSWTSEQARALTDRILSFSKAARVRGVAPALRGRAHPVRRQRHHDRRHGPDRHGRDHQPRRGPERLDDDRRARRLVAPRGRGPERGPDGRGAARPGAGRGARPAGLSRRSPASTRPPPPPARSSAATASRRPSTVPADRGLDASGFFENGARWSAIANKKGNFGFHRSTVRRVFDHDADRRRHRLGLRPVRAPAALGHRPGRPRRAGGDQGRVVGPAPRPAPGPLHRDPRARGGRRPADVADLLAQRPLRRRGAQLPLEARRRQPARRETLRRRRDPPLRPVRPAEPRPPLGRRRRPVRRLRRRRMRADSRPARRPGSRTASSRPSPSTATGRARPRSSPSRSPAA